MGQLPPAFPPLEYLLQCSEKSLGELELSALNRSQQCFRAAKEEMEQALAHREIAGVARWIIEHRPYLLEVARRTIEAESGQSVLQFPEAGPKLISSVYSKPSDKDQHTFDKSASLATRRYSR